MLFSVLADDIILKILWKIEDDPRDWARLSCVSTKFNSLIHDFCWKIKSSLNIPTELLTTPDPSLHKLPFCCPGPLHAGLLLENSENDQHPLTLTTTPPQPSQPHHLTFTTTPPQPPQPQVTNDSDASCWSLFDDLYHDTLYATTTSESENLSLSNEEISLGVDGSKSKKRKLSGSVNSHLALGKWSLSREQGSKLLGRQYRDDCLYVSDWPGCVHLEEKRNYMIFRGVFKNFKRTRVWRTVNEDCKRSRKLDLPCAFCSCNHTWDLHSSFCLRRGFGYHDDGEPVVRAYVCDNGHVSGAWTDVPMYT